MRKAKNKMKQWRKQGLGRQNKMFHLPPVAPMYLLNLFKKAGITKPTKDYSMEAESGEMGVKL